jgi:hypothetical protein
MRLLATTLALLPFVPLVAAPVPKTEPVDWKPVIENRQFKPNRVGVKAEKSVADAREAGLVAEFTSDADGCTGVFTFAVKDGPKLALSGHCYSVAVVREDMLYLADFEHGKGGGHIVAYDLATGKLAWRKTLDKMGVTCGDHIASMEIERHPSVKGANALVIAGQKDARSFIEVLDLRTGKQLALKKFGDDE